MRMREAAADFFGRMDARLAADRRRLREYYGALVREAEHKNKKTRSGESPDPEKLAAKKRAVDLELRRKLAELDERYAMEAVLEPLVLGAYGTSRAGHRSSRAAQACPADARRLLEPALEATRADALQPLRQRGFCAGLHR